MGLLDEHEQALHDQILNTVDELEDDEEESEESEDSEESEESEEADLPRVLLYNPIAVTEKPSSKITLVIEILLVAIIIIGQIYNLLYYPHYIKDFCEICDIDACDLFCEIRDDGTCNFETECICPMLFVTVCYVFIRELTILFIKIVVFAHEIFFESATMVFKLLSIILYNPRNFNTSVLLTEFNERRNLIIPFDVCKKLKAYA